MAEIAKALKWEQRIGGSSPTEGIGPFLSFTAFEIQQNDGISWHYFDVNITVKGVLLGQ